MFSTAALRAETAELPKSPKEATEMRRARRFKEEKRTRGKALSPKLPDIFINRRLNFSCVSFLGLI